VHATPKDDATSRDAPSATAPAGITFPKPLNYVAPVYPEDAKRDGIEAQVLLKLDISVTGEVSRVEVFRGAGQGFDDAAKSAALGLRFSPAKKADGTPFAARIVYRYVFAIEKVEVVKRVVVEEPRVATGTAAEAKQEPDVIDVLVEGQRPAREVTRRTIERREIERIPGTSGDALRSIQSLPGVARPPGLAGLLLVRGSSPQDTQTFVDGVGVPLIYHFGGLSSVIPTEVLSKIDFYPGNFSARYGRRQGGIVDAGIRDPKSDGYHGMAQLDLIDARLLLEGPIPGTEEWSFLVAGRRSWVDAWLGPVLEEAGAGVTTAPVYYDYQFVVQQRAKGREKDGFRMSFYGSDDALEIINNDPFPGEPALSGSLGLHTGFQRLQFGYQQTLSDKGRFVADLSVGHDEINFGLGALFFDLELFQLFGRLEYQHRWLPWFKSHVGIDMFRGVARVAARLPAAPAPGQPPNQPFSTRTLSEIAEQNSYYQPAAYLEFEMTPHARLRLVPGLRLDYARVTERWDVSPRINARFVVRDGFPRTTLKAGLGLYAQPPQFQEASPPFGSQGLASNRAVHYGLGVEQDVTKQVEISVEGFYKQLDRQVVPNADRTASLSSYSNQGSGYAAGAEVLLKYKPDKRFFGWLAYTLSRSERRHGRSEERRVGKECGLRCRSRWSPYH
jgi:TonB family protein